MILFWRIENRSERRLSACFQPDFNSSKKHGQRWSREEKWPSPACPRGHDRWCCWPPSLHSLAAASCLGRVVRSPAHLVQPVAWLAAEGRTPLPPRASLGKARGLDGRWSEVLGASYLRCCLASVRIRHSDVEPGRRIAPSPVLHVLLET